MDLVPIYHFMLIDAAVQPTGIWIKKHGKTVFVPVPEMVPEFVVPDLEGFKVSYMLQFKLKRFH